MKLRKKKTWIDLYTRSLRYDKQGKVIEEYAGLTVKQIQLIRGQMFLRKHNGF